MNQNISRKQKLQFAGFALTCIIFLIIAFSWNPRPKPVSEITPTPTPYLIGVYPPNLGEQELFMPDDSMTFTFNTQVNLDAVGIEITPFVFYSKHISDDGKTLIIQPDPQWKYDTEYTVKLTGTPVGEKEFKFLPRRPDLTKPRGMPSEPLIIGNDVIAR